MNCLSKTHPDYIKYMLDFSEIEIAKLTDMYFNGETPDYKDFIANEGVKKELGIVPISKVKDEIGTSYPKEIPNSGIINFKSKVSKTNNTIKGFVYKTFNINQRGQADLYTWGLRKIKGNLNVETKLERAKNKIVDASQNTTAISNLEKTNDSSKQLSLFQKKSNKEQKAIDKNLNENLKLFLNSYGISVNYVDGLDKLGYDAVAIADITNKLILISKGEESWDTLPEEAAHFAFELLGESNPLYIRLMDIIESTDIYKQTFEEYSEDVEYQKNGKPDIDKLKKEAIGKAITRNLVDSVGESRGFKATLKLILEKIKSIFGKINRSEFNKEVDKLTLGIAKSMKDGTFKGDIANLATSKAGILKSKKTVSKEEDSLKTAVKALETRLTMSKRSATPLEDVDKLNSDIIRIKDMIEERKAQAGLTIYINNILSELESMIDIMDAYNNEETRESVYLSDKKIHDVSEFLDTHKVALKKISSLQYDIDFKNRAPKTIEALKLTNNFVREIEEFFDDVLKERTVEVAEGMKHERSTLDVESALFKATKIDSGWLNLFLGKASNNKDELIRMVKNLLTKIKNRVERYTLDAGKALLDKQLALEATGFKDFAKFYERDKSGNKTGYIVSQYNIGEYQAAKKAYFEALRVRLGVDSLDMDKMSTAQKSEASKAFNLWKAEHTQEDPITKKAMPGRRYLNPVYQTMDKAQKEYYDALLRRQRDNLSKLPKRYRNDYSEFQLPALRKSVLQRLRSSEQSMWENFKAVKDETFNVKEEDTQFGTNEVYHNELTGDPIKFIPVHYTNMLENPNDLSDDLTGLYIAFTHMAENFNQKSANADKIWMIQKAINNRPYIGAKQTKPGSATNIAKMLQNIIDADFYEIQVNRNKYTKKVDAVINYVRRNNLLFNVFTHVANYTVGSVYSKIEDFAGKYSTNASKLWAEKTLDGNALGIMADMGARKKLNKVSLLMEHNNVIKDTKRIFSSLDLKTKAGRMLADSGLWATYELADYRIKAKIMLSVYDNYRYFDKKFINRQEYSILNKDKSASEISAGWDSLKEKSLWNMYEAVDGKLVIKAEVNEDTKNMIKGIVRQVSDQVDGKLSENDKPELYRNEIGRAILLHRGWLLQGAEARWKSNKLNYETGQFEEGYHRTFVKFMARATGIGANKMGNNVNTYGETIEYEKNLFTGAIKEAFANMTPEEKSNIAKATADMMFIMLATLVAGMLKNLGDDEENKDDYTIQFMAYMGQRFDLELTAFSNPFEIFNILSSPSAGINQVESVFDFVNTLISFDDEGNWKFTKPGSSGAYKDIPAYQKFLIKRSMLKPFYEASSAAAIKSKRTYLENMIMN